MCQSVPKVTLVYPKQSLFIVHFNCIYFLLASKLRLIKRLSSSNYFKRVMFRPLPQVSSGASSQLCLRHHCVGISAAPDLHGRDNPQQTLSHCLCSVCYPEQLYMDRMCGGEPREQQVYHLREREREHTE